jgi:hypothetical protein
MKMRPLSKDDIEQAFLSWFIQQANLSFDAAAAQLGIAPDALNDILAGRREVTPAEISGLGATLDLYARQRTHTVEVERIIAAISAMKGDVVKILRRNNPEERAVLRSLLEERRLTGVVDTVYNCTLPSGVYEAWRKAHPHPLR